MIKPLTASRIERTGIKLGTIAPGFTLPEIRGRSIALEAYRGQRVLLVFSDPRCGPCTTLAPYLVRAYHRRSSDPTIVMVSRRNAGENLKKAEEFGFEFPVVIQDRWNLSRQYGIFMTPVAFLIDEHGRTARTVAIGFEQIRSLLYEAFPLRPSDRIRETAGAMSRMFCQPIPRRDAFRAAGLMLAALGLSLIGMPSVARAVACQPGETPCGIDCCGQGWDCCGGECCPSQLMCCSGTCCAPTEVCIAGKCQQQVLP